ncbi:MAG: Rieske 2Fe-2S domain-containing protein [Candidatus Saccharibacteria bacterium]|nr:Rieske 2Fe-2S domain-containing protein [Rhodoferax sp.]
MTSPTHSPLWYELPHAPAPGSLVGAFEAFADNQATLVELTPAQTGSPAFKLLVLREGASVHAFANRCAHFGVPLAAQQAQLIYRPLKSLTCNVHYARYAWASGACEAGECGDDALSPVPLVHDADGWLRIGSRPDSA